MFSFFSAHHFLLFCGALVGYALILFAAPIRSSLRDGLRVLRRYPFIWLVLGLFSFCYALFSLGLRWYFSSVAAPGAGPVFLWSRSAFYPSWSWVFGLRDSLWSLPPHAFDETVRQAALLALDDTAGLFNNLVSTFPLAALAGLGLLLNAEHRAGILWRALRKRFGRWGWSIHLLILLGALAALLKPFLYLAPHFLPAEKFAAWYQWSPILASAGFLFEYLFGVYVQVLLILLAYCWVRGITPEHHRLLDFAIRRSSLVLRWALVVMLLTVAGIEIPLILTKFSRFASWFPDDAAISDRRLAVARIAIDGVLLLFATVQITLIFHSESLQEALRDHARFVWRNAWSFGWFLLIAAFHLYLLHGADRLLRSGFGEGAALWTAWILLFPWLHGIVAAWLLASWVSVFHRCDRGLGSRDGAIKF